MITECPTCAARGFDNEDYYRLHHAWCDSVAEVERLLAVLRLTEEPLRYFAGQNYSASKALDAVHDALKSDASRTS